MGQLRGSSVYSLTPSEATRGIVEEDEYGHSLVVGGFGNKNAPAGFQKFSLGFVVS